MRFALEALRIDFVDVFGARRPGRKPALGGGNLQPANWRIVAGRASQLIYDRFTREARFHNSIWRKPLELCLLLRRSRRIDARVVGRAELGGQLTIVLAGVLACTSGDFRGEQVHDRSVFIGAPDGAVEPQKAGPCAFLTAEAARAIK